MVEVQNLCKNYGSRRAIQNLNFTIKKGEVVGFLGPNGAGKSTTMKIITGFMAPTSGEVRINGQDVFEDPLEVKRRIGYLPELPPVYNEMYVRSYLQFVAELKRVPRSEITRNIDYAIEKTQLQAVSKRLIGHLSKGFKQRVGIAQALVSQPEVLILDEPTVGLDPKQVAEIRSLINELKSKHTIILSTHILSEVEATCEKVIIINNGQIVAQDRIQDLNKYSTGRQQFTFRVMRDVPALGASLLKIQGVENLTAQNENLSWTFEYSGDGKQAEQFTRAIVESGAGLLEFSSTRLNLEDVFLKLTYGENQKAHSSDKQESLV